MNYNERVGKAFKVIGVIAIIASIGIGLWVSPTQGLRCLGGGVICFLWGRWEVRKAGEKY